MQPLVEEADDGPAHGQIAELPEGAQIAKESLRLGLVAKREDRIEEGGGVVGSPGRVDRHVGYLDRAPQLHRRCGSVVA